MASTFRKVADDGTAILNFVRIQCEKTGLGLNTTLVLMVLLSVVPGLLLRRWVYTRKLPPSPPGWPVIGHLHLLGTHVHQSLAQLSDKYGPLMYLKFGTKGTVIVSSADMAKEVFRKHDFTFSQRPSLIILDLLITNKQGIAFQSNNSSWRNLRKIFMLEIMSPKRMIQGQQLRSEEVALMLKSIYQDINAHPNTPIEINGRLWSLTTNFISRLILSKRYFAHEGAEENEEAKEFKYVMTEMFFLIGSIFPADSLPFLKPFDIGGLEKRAKKLTPRFQAILTRHLSERRKKRREDGDSHVDLDMVDVLLTAQEKGGEEPITEGNIRGLVWDAFSAGTDTQITASEWAMAHLVHDPKIMNRLQSELDDVIGVERKVTESDVPNLKYLQALVKETFRLHPPVPLLLPHECYNACNIAGYDVPANTRLFVNAWAMGRDAKIWEKPLEFNPDRFMKGSPHENIDVTGQNYELLPFGTGRRICPAVSTGLTNVQIAIASLVQAFDWSLPEGAKASDLDMSESPGFITPMANPLHAIPKPRLAAALY